MSEEGYDTFWREYVAADMIKRGDKIKNLPIMKELKFIHNAEIDEEHKETMLVTLFQSYIDDVIEYMERTR